MTILIEETIKEFGHNPFNLSRGSHKKVCTVCDKCGELFFVERRHFHSLCVSCSLSGEGNPMFNKHHTEEAKNKMRMANTTPQDETRERMRKNHADVSGERNPFYRRTHTEESIEKIKQANALYIQKYPNARSEQQKKYLSEHPEARERLRKQREKQRMPKHHTGIELIFEQICKVNNLGFHYVGDGSLWIGKRKKLNPDFIEANGKRICIDILGDYWHSPLVNFKIPEYTTLNYRERHYRKFKWQPVFIWGSDLLRPDAEQFVLTLLKKESVI